MKLRSCTHAHPCTHTPKDTCTLLLSSQIRTRLFHPHAQLHPCVRETRVLLQLVGWNSPSEPSGPMSKAPSTWPTTRRRWYRRHTPPDSRIILRPSKKILSRKTRALTHAHTHTPQLPDYPEVAAQAEKGVGQNVANTTLMSEKLMDILADPSGAAGGSQRLQELVPKSSHHEAAREATARDRGRISHVKAAPFFRL